MISGRAARPAFRPDIVKSALHPSPPVGGARFDPRPLRIKRRMASGRVGQSRCPFAQASSASRSDGYNLTPISDVKRGRFRLASVIRPQKQPVAMWFQSHVHSDADPRLFVGQHKNFGTEQDGNGYRLAWWRVSAQPPGVYPWATRICAIQSRIGRRTVGRPGALKGASRERVSVTGKGAVLPGTAPFSCQHDFA